MKYKHTTIKISIHPEGENPVFSEQRIDVSIDDEAAGPFLVLERETDEEGGSKIKLDYAELLEIVKAAKFLMDQEAKK